MWSRRVIIFVNIGILLVFVVGGLLVYEGKQLREKANYNKTEDLRIFTDGSAYRVTVETWDDYNAGYDSVSYLFAGIVLLFAAIVLFIGVNLD